MIEGRKILGSIGLAILVVFAIVAVLAPHIAPYDPHQMYGRLEPPSLRHLLGTDNIGNDILSELIYGTRVSLFIAFVVSTISMLVGTSLGLIAGYFDKLGFLIMRVVDVFLAIPRLPLIIVIASFIRPSVWNLIAIFLIFGWLMTARIIRSEVLTLRRRYYVDATKMIGGSDFYILWRHILPNVVPLVVVQFIMEAIHVILAESGLSFLGLGDPIAKSWGMVLHDAFVCPIIYVSDVWMWWMLPPGLCIVFTVLGLTFVGYAIEETLNPKLKSSVIGMEL
ncbi:MAG: ABC transporter permease [Zetaproteobacteria bacterium]|jgi:ABC-type dipeptide/oligopeptide/nickel transport system permease subunit|nr:ABC transporter permease [Zetaproteobacteria bacterium]NOQ29337.1 ABC transporter permease subunit [Methanosarcinales archaeon]